MFSQMELHSWTGNLGLYRQIHEAASVATGAWPFILIAATQNRKTPVRSCGLQDFGNPA